MGEPETDIEGGQTEDGRVYSWKIIYDESHFNEGITFVHKVEGATKIEAINNWLAHLFRSGLLTVEKDIVNTGVDPYI